MMGTQMTGYSTQIHTIHVHLQRFLAGLFIIDPLLGFRGVFDMTVHASVTLASCVCLSSSVLSISSFTFWAGFHSTILAHFLATLGVVQKVVVLKGQVLMTSETPTAFPEKYLTISSLRVKLQDCWLVKDHSANG